MSTPNDDSQPYAQQSAASPYPSPDAAIPAPPAAQYYPGYAPGQQAPGAPGYGVDPSAPYGRDPMTGFPLSDKSKTTAGLLQIFLGAFGAGRFYIGDTGTAIAQIAVTWLTCGIGGIWPFIDGIMMFTGNVRDSKGLTLRS